MADLTPPDGTDATRPGTRLDSLTGLRAAAALSVFVCHLDWVFEGLRVPKVGQVSPIIFQGWLGVSFFFVLSGFVLTWSARPHDQPGRFYGRRVARIYPAHVVVWLIWAALLPFALVGNTQYPTGVVGAVASLLLVQAWFPSHNVHFAMNGPSWSLSAEMFFYLCFPALLPLVSRLRRRGLVILGVACLAFVAGLAFVVRRRLGVKIDEATTYWTWTMPLMRLPEFVLGIVLARLVRGHRLPRIPLTPAIAVGAVAWVATRWVPRPFGNAVGLVFIVAVIVAAAQVDLTGARSFWSRPWVVHLGVISFAFYLVHSPVLSVIENGLDGYEPSFPAGIAIGLVALAISLALAELLYRVVERPAERWLRGRLDPRAGPSEIDPTVTVEPQHRHGDTSARPSA